MTWNALLCQAVYFTHSLGVKIACDAVNFETDVWLERHSLLWGETLNFGRDLLLCIHGFSLTWWHDYPQWLTSLASTFQACSNDRSQLWGKCNVTTFLFQEEWKIAVGGKRRKSSEMPRPPDTVCYRVSNTILGYKVISHYPIMELHMTLSCSIKNKSIRVSLSRVYF